uniref:DUF3456 domain-containing protein n=1 Tax=Aureoumbra lagunensis TaxID=44058 RepID=A0A7S3JW27_9STRA
MKALLLFLFCAFIITETSTPPEFNDARCGSCIAIADELKSQQCAIDSKENLDLTTPTGKRIEYATSELRIHDILSGVCRGMSKYTIVKKDVSDSLSFFQRKSEIKEGKITLGGEHTTAIKRKLRNFCDKIIEEHEDDITPLIIPKDDQTQTNNPSDMRTTLCVDIISICNMYEIEVISEAIGPTPECSSSPPQIDDYEEGKYRQRRQKKRKKKSSSSLDL